MSLQFLIVLLNTRLSGQEAGGGFKGGREELTDQEESEQASAVAIGVVRFAVKSYREISAILRMDGEALS